MKTIWEQVEEAAQINENVSPDYKLRMADIDYDADWKRFAQYRLKNLNNNEVKEGKVYF